MKNTTKSISLLLISAFTIALAGTGKSVGTAGGIELLIPTGAKGIALFRTGLFIQFPLFFNYFFWIFLFLKKI